MISHWFARANSQVADESATVISFDLQALQSNDTEKTVSRDLCEFLSTTSIMKVRGTECY